MRLLSTVVAALRGWLHDGAFLIAPLALCVVAALQFALVETRHLSPWKGGGFGMFSTADSPAARFVRLSVLTKDGRRSRVVVPGPLVERGLRARTMPDDEASCELVKGVQDGTWTPLAMESASHRYEVLSGTEAPTNDTVASHADPADAALRRDRIRFDSLKFARMLDDDETPAPAQEVLELQSVRMEIWRYDFEQEQPALTASLLHVAETAQCTD